MDFNKAECQDLQILINRVPGLSPAEAHAFVALSSKLQAEINKPDPAPNVEQVLPPAETA